MRRGTPHKVSQGASTPGCSTCVMAQENSGAAYATKEASNIHINGMAKLQVSQSVVTLGCSMEYVTDKASRDVKGHATYGAIRLGTYMVAERV